jgi:Protein of unknown function (DUF2568)
MRALAEGAAFLLELCALAALAYWGSTENVVLAIVAPLAFAVIWGVFASPRARVQLPPWPKFALRVGLLLGSAVALAVAGQRGLALALGAAVLADNVLLAALGRPVAGG